MDVTPRDLAAMYGIPPKTIRDVLRATLGLAPGGRWRFAEGGAELGRVHAMIRAKGHVPRHAG